MQAVVGDSLVKNMLNAVFYNFIPYPVLVSLGMTGLLIDLHKNSTGRSKDIWAHNCEDRWFRRKPQGGRTSA
jgi:hypothetical protein